MPRVGAQPPKGNPALCHVKTCSGKMGKAFLCIPSFVANAAQCQPWPFNGQFWNSVGYLCASPGLSLGHFIHSVWLLVWFPSAATIKWLAWTFLPTMKLVIEPASAILLHSFCYLRKFPTLATIKWLASIHQPNLTLVIGLNTQLSRQIQPKRMADAGSITNFMGWQVEASVFVCFCCGSTWKSYK